MAAACGLLLLASVERFAGPPLNLGGVGDMHLRDSASYLSTIERSPTLPGTDAAVAEVQRHLQRFPADGGAYGQLGMLYLQRAREMGHPSYYGKAEGALVRALELAPASMLAVAGMGSLSVARHRFEDALEWGERARELAPHSALPYGIIGDAELGLGRYAEAIVAYQAMVDRRPDLSSLSRAAYARELHGDIPGAIDAMQRAVGAGAPHSEPTAWARTQLGHLYFIGGEFNQAERQYRAALRIMPNYAPSLAGRGQVAAARGALQEAISLYTRALELMPLPAYAVALAEVHRATGDDSAARDQEDLVRAIARLYQANGVDVDLEMALFEADYAQDAEAILAAVEAAQARYQRWPSVHAADSLGWTLYRADRPEEALPYAREALRLGTRDPLMLFHAGAIAAREGQPGEARGYLEAALAQNARFSVRYASEAVSLLQSLSLDGSGS